MKISAKTDVGKVRSNNQDSYAAGDLTSEVSWAVVCDGMGGANGGNIASEAAVKVISDKLTSGYHVGMNDNSVKNLLISSVMVDNGEITPEEAKEHPKKNVITRALGVDPEVRIDYSQEQLNEDDLVLLCTDGLTNYVDDEVILEVCKTEDRYKIADKLVELANENGGGDNITVVTVSE